MESMRITQIRLFVPLVLFSLILVAVPGQALAGEVKLVSKTWDHVCKVVVKWGRNAPEMSVGTETYWDVEKGKVVATKPDKICYRRPVDVRDCNSPLTENWTCLTSTQESGTEEISLD